jgi:uncharacterized protein YndB with AHSA1/START domain
MQHVVVQVYIDAPIERVFDAVSDHERFLSADDGTKTKLLREGTAERNGLGCIREVRVGRRARYVEEITAWERPFSFEYTIRETSLPLRHQGSRITFTAKRGGTDVEWTSRFAITVPVLGRFLRARAERRYAKAFTGLLQAAKARLEGGQGRV